MSLLLVGISHHTAPVEERERFAVPEPALAEALVALLQEPGVAEALILSTCNRVELLVDASDGAEPDLAGFLARLGGEAGEQCRPKFYRHSGPEAVRHLFRVAASLDSLVVGEPQILGQLKQALLHARRAGSIGQQLDRALTRSFRVAKRIRNETEIASQPVSVSRAAVELVRQIFGSLEGKTVLVVGAGAMGELTARALQQHGAASLLFTNRTLARAEGLAHKYGGEAFALEALPREGARADVVITCAGAGTILISRSDAAHFLAQRRQRPMLFLDLAVPRDVEAGIHQLGNAFVYNVDDLERVVSFNLSERRREAVEAEQIVTAELAAFLDHQQTRELAPTLSALQAHGEALLRTELERLRRRAVDLSPAQAEEIEIHMRRFMQKLLHQPLVGLREAAGEPEQELLVDLVQRLFRLEIKSNAVAASKAEAASEAPNVRTAGVH